MTYLTEINYVVSGDLIGDSYWRRDLASYFNSFVRNVKGVECVTLSDFFIKMSVAISDFFIIVVGHTSFVAIL